MNRQRLVMTLTQQVNKLGLHCNLLTYICKAVSKLNRLAHSLLYILLFQSVRFSLRTGVQQCRHNMLCCSLLLISSAIISRQKHRVTLYFVRTASRIIENISIHRSVGIPFEEVSLVRHVLKMQIQSLLKADRTISVDLRMLWQAYRFLTEKSVNNGPPKSSHPQP